MNKNKRLKTFSFALLAVAVSASTSAMAQTQEQLDGNKKPTQEEIQEYSDYNLNPNSLEYQEALERRRLELELNQQLQALENAYQFESQMRGSLPPSSAPDQILEYRRRSDQILQAQNARIYGDVEEIYDTKDLEPQQNKPIKIKVVPGYIATLTFFDSTGSPWPVEYAKAGNESFTMETVGEKGNVVNIDTSQLHNDANASIGLVGMSTNYTITLKSNNKVNTSKMSFRIPERGPEASNEPVVTSSVVENAPPEMYDLLNGRASTLEGAQLMKLKGVEGDAYQYKGMLYIITKHYLRAPARENSVSLPSGLKAYKIYPTSSLQFSVDGERVFATVEKATSLR